MKTFTTSDIQSWNPCISPLQFVPETWKGTALDMLQHTGPADIWHRIWVILRPQVMEASQIVEYKAWHTVRAMEILRSKGFVPHGKSFPDIDHRVARGENLYDHLENLVWEMTDRTEQKQKLIQILTR